MLSVSVVDGVLHIDQVVGSLSESTLTGNEFHFGSQDLIRLADYASTHGFDVVSFMVADDYLVLIEVNQQIVIPDKMVELLNTYGGVELAAAMSDEYADVYVIGITLISASGRHMLVKRRGFVEMSAIHEAEQLLRAAWQELRLS